MGGRKILKEKERFDPEVPWGRHQFCWRNCSLLRKRKKGLAKKDYSRTFRKKDSSGTKTGPLEGAGRK